MTMRGLLTEGIRWRAPLVAAVALALLLAGIVPRPMLAAPGGQVGAFTLEQGLRLALEHSPRIETSQSALRQAKAVVAEVGSLRSPRLDASGELSRGLEAGFSLPGVPLPIAPPEAATQGRLTLSYSQFLFNAGDVRINQSRAELGATMAELQAEAEAAALVADVVRAYTGVLEAASALQMGRVYERNAEAAHRMTRDRFADGTASEADVLAADAGLARARQGVQMAERSLELAYDALYLTMGVDRPEVWPALGPVDHLLLLSELEQDLGELRHRALYSQPQLRQAALGLAQAELGLRQTARSSRPRIELSGNYTWLDDERSLFASLDDQGSLRVGLSQAHSFGDPATSPGAANDPWQVGVGVNWNLFDSGGQAARVEQAREQVNQADLQLAQLEAAITSNLSRLYSDVVQALQELSVAEREIQEVEVRLRAMQQQLEAGTTTPLAVSSVEADGAAAQHRHLQAGLQLIRARVALLIAAGTGSDEMLALLGDVR